MLWQGQGLLLLLALLLFVRTVTWRATVLQPKPQHNAVKATLNNRAVSDATPRHQEEKEEEVNTRLQLPMHPAPVTTENTISEGITDHNEVKPNFQVYKSDKEYSGKGNFFQPYVVEQYKLVFFHIPKNGCTKWKWIMRKLSGITEPLPLNQTIHNPEYNGIPRLGNFSTERASEFFMAADWTRAMFLRDPVERWLSAYLNKVARATLHLDRCCHKVAKQNQNSTSTATITRITDWEQCRQSAQSSPEQGFAVMKRCKDVHWNPQSSRLSHPRYWPAINFWGRVEDMDRDTERLLRRIGAWTNDDKKAKQSEDTAVVVTMTDNATEDRAVAKQTGQFHASHASEKVDQYISPELRRQLVEFYHEDYNNPYFDFVDPFANDESSVSSPRKSSQSMPVATTFRAASPNPGR